MDSIYYVVTIALVLFALIWLLQHISDQRRELQRHKDAAINYRRFVAEQKAKFITDLVDRLDLRTSYELPGLSLGLFSKVDDLYRDPSLRGYRMPVLAIDEHTITWTRALADLDDPELFVLWFEGVLAIPFVERSKCVHKVWSFQDRQCKYCHDCNSWLPMETVNEEGE